MMRPHIIIYRLAIIIGCLTLAGGLLLTEGMKAGKAEVRKLDACEEYIQNYYRAAIRQQHKHRIPASITLAQGILESSAGKSYLAVEGNNHFGIKCGNWTGDFLYKHDDGRLERFRKYASVEQSFEDHSRFIAERDHYKALFDLKPTDYVGWAHGLKKYGYATDPKYAGKLIELIERYQLHTYDLAKVTSEPIAPSKPKKATSAAAPEKKQTSTERPVKKAVLDPKKEMAVVKKGPGRKPTAHGIKALKKAKPEPDSQKAQKKIAAQGTKETATKKSVALAAKKQAPAAPKADPAKKPAPTQQIAAKKPTDAKPKIAVAKKPAPTKQAAAEKKSATAPKKQVLANAKKPVAPKKVAPQTAAKKPVAAPKKNGKLVASSKKPNATSTTKTANPKRRASQMKKPAVAAVKAKAPVAKTTAKPATKPAPARKTTSSLRRDPKTPQKTSTLRRQNNNERPTVHTARRQRLERRRA